MSATYQITSLTTISTSTVSLDELSKRLQLNSIVSFEGSPIGLVTHWDLVFFSRTWAGWALEDYGEKPSEEVLVALSLVDQWLQDPHSVSGEELNAAAEAAWAAEAAAGAAAWAAAGAAWAAAEAARAAWAVARAAEAAARTAARVGRAAAYQKQGKFIVEHLKNSSQTSFPSSAA